MIKVRIRGIDNTVRELSKLSDDTFNYARVGCRLSAEYLMMKIVAKFGVYQPTGGDPGGHGAWKKLTFETIKKKISKYGVGNKPLIASGETKDSFSIVMGGKGRLSASVGSDSPVLIHHIYGAPRAKVPMRDPVRVTAVEQRDECQQIIIDEIMKGLM